MDGEKRMAVVVAFFNARARILRYMRDPQDQRYLRNFLSGYRINADHFTFEPLSEETLPLSLLVRLALSETEGNERYSDQLQWMVSQDLTVFEIVMNYLVFAL